MTPKSLNRSTREVVAALIVAIVSVLALDVVSIATSPASHAAASVVAPATPIKSQFRMIRWSGQTWLVAGPQQNGPDNDPMSDSKAAVYVDSRGRLHLTMTKVDGVWRSTEIEDPVPTDYGTYKFVVNANLSKLAKPLDLGMFVINPSAPRLTAEVDLENSRALLGMKHGLDSQYVVQPYTKPHHLVRYKIGSKARITQQSFNWTKNNVRFLTRRGTGKHAPILKKLHYKGPDAPADSGMYLHINLFVHGHNNPPVKSGVRTVILNSFTYTPSP